MKKSLCLLIGFIFFILDIFLKIFVVTFSSQILSGNFYLNFSILPFIHFDLAYAENTGMAWGMFSSFQYVILFIRIVLISALFFGMIKSKYVQNQMLPFALIFFGALANVIDTFIYGHVIDMIHFTFWNKSYGIFNIADAMIFIGAVWLIFSRKKINATEE